MSRVVILPQACLITSAIRRKIDLCQFASSNYIVILAASQTNVIFRRRDGSALNLFCYFISFCCLNVNNQTKLKLREA